MIIADVFKNLYGLSLAGLLLSLFAGVLVFVLLGGGVRVPGKVYALLLLVFVASLVGVVLLAPS